MNTINNELVDEARAKLERISQLLRGHKSFCGQNLTYEDCGEVRISISFWSHHDLLDCDFIRGLVATSMKYLEGFGDIDTDISPSGKDMRIFTTYIGTETEADTKLKMDAKKKLDAVADIFKGRDGDTTAWTELHYCGGKVFGRIRIRTTGQPFEKEMERQLIIANLELQGGFTDIAVTMMNGGRSMLVRAIYDGKEGIGLRHGEHTIADLLQLIKDHRKEFPNGLLTKVSLGDYEGNSYHRHFTAGGDDGRLYLSFEMNEHDGE